MDKFNDFSALKALKKDLEEKESSGKEGAPQPKKRSRTDGKINDWIKFL